MTHAPSIRALCACVLLLLLGCGRVPGNIDADAASATVRSETPAERSLASYLHDLSPVIEGVTRENARLEHYTIPTSSGYNLDAWVRRPPGDAGQPLVLVISPYYGGGDPSSPANVQADVLARDPSWGYAQYLIPRGYAVGFVSVGGTGNSGGCFRDGGEIERKQLYDAVEYLAAQPWSNGAVASMGVSYDGTTANELFVEAPPSLKTVVPMEAISDFYRYSFNNGMRRNGNSAFTAYYYPVVGAAPAGLEGGVGPSEPQGFVQELAGEPCADQVFIQSGGAYSTATGDKLPWYWDERDAIKLLLGSLSQPRPSMFFIQGYGDANVDSRMADGFLEAVRATGVPLHIWQGQWGHQNPQPGGGTVCDEFAPCRGDFFESFLLAWFDQFLLGRDTGVLDAPAVQTQADDGVWRHEEQWPPDSAPLRAWHAAADGGFADVPAAAGSVAYDDDNLAVEAGSFIEFVSAPLTEPLRLTGTPRLETLATASAAKAGLVATLLERFPDGTQRSVNFAAQSLNHVLDLGRGEMDITGKARAVSVNFFPLDSVLTPGSQLVLQIGGRLAATTATQPTAGDLPNNGPSLLPVGMGARVQMELRDTRLLLPVNPGDRVEPLDWLD